MKTIQESSREVPLLCEEMDVIVIGGGAAGIGAAISAARNGAKTIIIERFGFLAEARRQPLMIPLHGWTTGSRAVSYRRSWMISSRPV